MTNEQHIENLKKLKSYHNGSYGSDIDKAIKALEQESCDDAISRQALLDAFGFSEKTRKWGGDHSGYDTMMLYEIQDVIESQPPVNPQEPKTGHWIMPVQDDGMSDPMYYQVRCSKCGFDLDPQTWHMELHQYDADKYCPKCGTPMIEPQESEGSDGNNNL